MSFDRPDDVAARRGSAPPSAPGSITYEAYAAWLAEADHTTSRRQPVQLELVAEHHLMGAVLLAMDQEWRRIHRGGSLNTSFWAGVVDFNGNFVHLCHRVKEEELLIPALIESGGLEREYAEAVHREHERAKRLTLGICDGVGEGDWEGVMRLVAMYVGFLRPHMQHEELELFGALSTDLPAQTQAELRAAFTLVEGRALGGAGRRHYVDVAAELTRAAGIEYPL